MRKVLMVVLAMIGMALPLYAQTAVSGSKLAWDQAAPDLATAQGYTYRHYDDALGGVVLNNVTCQQKVPSVVGVFDCSTPFPPYTPGSHTVMITAANEAGESLKSTALAFTFVVVPSVPTNIRIIKG